MEAIQVTIYKHLNELKLNVVFILSVSLCPELSTLCGDQHIA